MMFVSYCVSNIIGPQFFKTSQAPLYPLGTGAILGSYVLSLMTISAYMFVCWSENKRRDAHDATAGEIVHHDTDFRDMTDKQNPVYHSFQISIRLVLTWMFIAFPICLVSIAGFDQQQWGVFFNGYVFILPVNDRH